MPNGKPSYATTWDVIPFHGTGPGEERTSLGAVQFFIGLDGLNIWLVALASFMMIPVILLSWDTIQRFARGRTTPGCSFSRPACWACSWRSICLLFYVCFELTLVPLLFLIGGWGPGPNRRDAARKLFLFTLAGGLITLLGVAGTVLFVYDKTGQLTFSIPRLADMVQSGMNKATAEPARDAVARKPRPSYSSPWPSGLRSRSRLCRSTPGCRAPTPKAPIGVTVMLSALLAKMGTFGLVRICLPLCPDATLAVGMPLLGVLATIGIVYGAFCAYAQTDIAPAGRIQFPFASWASACSRSWRSTRRASAGGVLHMVNHGLSTGAMFLLVGMLIRRYGTAQIADYSGMWTRLPQSDRAS